MDYPQTTALERLDGMLNDLVAAVPWMSSEHFLFFVLAWIIAVIIIVIIHLIDMHGPGKVPAPDREDVPARDRHDARRHYLKKHYPGYRHEHDEI